MYQKNIESQMELFISIFNQMIFLFAFIAIGLILSKWNFLPNDAAKTISKLENMIFVPCLVMYTFIQNCNLETLSSVWKLLFLAFVMVVLLIPISVLVAKFCFKGNYLRKIATYGLTFSNFGFMGNAIMNAIFPEIFFEYTIFTLPFWFMIYLWGVPVLDDSRMYIIIKCKICQVNIVKRVPKNQHSPFLYA